jgi:XTP/dITP diphosphohydrolase
VTSRRVVVATKNRGKLEEIRAALEVPGWEFVPGDELGTAPDVEETGETFLANALLKAEEYAGCFALAALADDSGLEVDALAGAPGVRSSRYAGEKASDADNNARLLAELSSRGEGPWPARFRCVMTLVGVADAPVIAQGTCEGRILATPRGSGGFGYDPLFEPAATPGRTMAELSTVEKNAVSHRGAALAALKAMLGVSQA